MEFKIIFNQTLYTVTVDVSWNLYNEDKKSWVEDENEFYLVKDAAKKYLNKIMNT